MAARVPYWGRVGPAPAGRARGRKVAKACTPDTPKEEKDEDVADEEFDDTSGGASFDSVIKGRERRGSEDERAESSCAGGS